ncbi:MAG: hypothetical protein N2167_03180 [Flavobacteriales bacterium]|nr:hypothetical protein [Flavobacteriales bacterium]
MKKIFLPIIGTFILFSCGPKKDPNLTYFEKAEEYNDYIIKEQVELFAAFDEFIHQMETGNMDQLQASFDKLYERSKTAVERMEKLADFKKNTEFRDKSKELFIFYKTQCETDLKEMLTLFEKDTLMTEADQIRIEEIANAFDNTEKKLNDALIAAQEAFAKKFNLELVEDKPL